MKTPNSTMIEDDANYYPSDVYICEQFNLDSISGAIYIVIFVFSITGNALVLGILLFGEKLKTVTSLFILNLTCSDLVFTFTLPFWAYYYLHHWVFGEYACKLVTAAYIIGVYSSVILLTAITVDRFNTVVLQWPSNPVRRKKFAVASCMAAWIISTAASVNDAVNVKVDTYWNFTSCVDASPDSEVNVGYYLHVSLLFFLPFTIIVFCYSVILKNVLRPSIRGTYWTVVMILCIVAAFFICWGPYNILLIFKMFYVPQTCDAEKTLYVIYSACRILAYSHCCMNPLIYVIPKSSRKVIWSLLRCRNSNKDAVATATATAAVAAATAAADDGQSTTVVHNVAFTVQNSAV